MFPSKSAVITVLLIILKLWAVKNAAVLYMSLFCGKKKANIYVFSGQKQVNSKALSNCYFIFFNLSN